MAEAQPPSSAPSPASPELPTASANLTIKVGPAQPWGTAKGIVPPGQAHYLVTTFSMLGCAIAGIGGVVLTLHVAHGTTGVVLAFAELALALVVAVLIAVAGQTRTATSRKRAP